MKELPPDPPIYQAPPERWFIRYEHPKGDTTPLALTKTLNAMWLTLLDRRGDPLQTKEKKFTVVEQEMLRKLLTFTRLTDDSFMAIWCSACNRANMCESADTTFRNLLSRKGPI